MKKIVFLLFLIIVTAINSTKATEDAITEESKAHLFSIMCCYELKKNVPDYTIQSLVKTLKIPDNFEGIDLQESIYSFSFPEIDPLIVDDKDGQITSCLFNDLKDVLLKNFNEKEALYCMGRIKTYLKFGFFYGSQYFSDD